MEIARTENPHIVKTPHLVNCEFSASESRFCSTRSRKGDVMYECNSVWMLEPTYSQTTYDVTDDRGVKLFPECVYAKANLYLRYTSNSLHAIPSYRRRAGRLVELISKS